MARHQIVLGTAESRLESGKEPCSGAPAVPKRNTQEACGRPGPTQGLRGSLGTPQGHWPEGGSKAKGKPPRPVTLLGALRAGGEISRGAPLGPRQGGCCAAGQEGVSSAGRSCTSQTRAHACPRSVTDGQGVLRARLGALMARPGSGPEEPQGYWLCDRAPCNCPVRSAAGKGAPAALIHVQAVWSPRWWGEQPQNGVEISGVRVETS